MVNCSPIIILFGEQNEKIVRIMKDWKCDGCHCDTSVEDDFEYEFCCSGLREQCGCMGMPTNPVFCEECEKKITGQIKH
jgi:hypothetical protein